MGTSRLPVWYLVKGLCEIHYDHVRLSVITIQCTIQIANQIMEELNQVGFARPLTSETMLSVSILLSKARCLFILLTICAKVLQQMHVHVSDTGL